MATADLPSLEKSYVTFVEFLMISKHHVFEMAIKHGLTGMQAITLCLLDKPRPMHTLGKVFNCDPSNITGIIDGLEHKGLVARFENPDDRRLKMVEIRHGGLAIRTALLQELCGPTGYLMSKLNPSEASQFTKLVAKITNGELSI
jgi:DNA-binding MarR family transcriptional regulator